MKQRHAITIVLLAGGRATRLPGKLALPVEGEQMLLRAYRQLTRTGRPCIISVREALPEELARHMPVRTVTDRYPDAGPLGGLASAAAAVLTPLLFAAAGDLPYIDSDVIDALERAYRNEAKHSGRKPDAVLPRHADGNVEPLAALYDTAALLRSAVRLLESGRNKVTDALAGLHVIFFDIAPREEKKYHNINTAADLASIEAT